jgi:hypothetical protein
MRTANGVIRRRTFGSATSSTGHARTSSRLSGRFVIDDDIIAMAAAQNQRRLSISSAGAPPPPTPAAATIVGHPPSAVPIPSTTLPTSIAEGDTKRASSSSSSGDARGGTGGGPGSVNFVWTQARPRGTQPVIDTLRLADGHDNQMSTNTNDVRQSLEDAIADERRHWIDDSEQSAHESVHFPNGPSTCHHYRVGDIKHNCNCAYESVDDGVGIRPSNWLPYREPSYVVNGRGELVATRDQYRQRPFTDTPIFQPSEVVHKIPAR